MNDDYSWQSFREIWLWVSAVQTLQLPDSCLLWRRGRRQLQLECRLFYSWAFQDHGYLCGSQPRRRCVCRHHSISCWEAKRARQVLPSLLHLKVLCSYMSCTQGKLVKHDLSIFSYSGHELWWWHHSAPEDPVSIRASQLKMDPSPPCWSRSPEPGQHLFSEFSSSVSFIHCTSCQLHAVQRAFQNM